MRIKIVHGLLFFVALAFCLIMTSAVMAASAEEEIFQLMKKNDIAMNTSDFDLMSTLWWQSPKTSFFGPIKKGSFLTQGWESLARVLKDTMSVPSGTVDFHMRHPVITMLGDNAAFGTLYHIRIMNDPKTKERIIGSDRFTYVFQKINGKWLIIHCHISEFPH